MAKMLAIIALLAFSCGTAMADIGPDVEHKVLTTPPLSEVAGISPIPSIDEYFACVKEYSDEKFCMNLAQAQAQVLLTLPAKEMMKKCVALDRGEEACTQAMNDMVRNSFILSNAVRALAFGAGTYVDDEFGRGTLGAVLFAAQDANVGALSLISNDQEWMGYGMVQRKKCEKLNADKGDAQAVAQACSANAQNASLKRVQDLARRIGAHCRGGNREQCIKNATDYIRRLDAFAESFALFDNYCREISEDTTRLEYARMVVYDLQAHVLEVLLREAVTRNHDEGSR